jgi:phytoene/squalene synthetase
MSSPYQASAASHRYVLDLVRGADRNRFLCSLFAPEPARSGLLALLALDHELARTPSVTSEPLLAEIRIEWWREAATEAAGTAKPRAQPVVEALSETARRHGLALDGLLALVDARAEEINGPLDVVRTGNALADLQLAVLGVDDEASRRAARVVAAAGLMGEGRERADLLAEARSRRDEINRAALPILLPARLLGRRLTAWQKPIVLWWAAQWGQW